MTSLVAVRTALKSSDSEHAALFTSLMDDGKMNPYKSKEVAKRKLGLQEADYPILGKKQAPIGLRKPYSTKDLQDLCLRDLPEAREYFGDRLIYFAQSGTANDVMEMSEKDAGMQTINNLTGTSPGAADAIVTFPSEALEEVRREPEGSQAPEHLLRTTMTTCTVLPGNTLLQLQHSNEGTTVTTLLTGSIIWIFWPLTDYNLRTLQTAYEEFADDFDNTKLDVASDLEGGMIFVQTEGDGLRIPPFSLMMSLTTKASVLATYTQVTAQNLIFTLQKLPLLVAWFRTELDCVRKQAEFNASILLCLDLILNGDTQDNDRNNFKLSYIKGGPLHALLNVWDSIKNDIAAMMGPADSKTIENIWEAFLVASVGRECRICDKSIRNKQRLMRKHFTESHWPKTTETKRIDSMEVVQDGLGAAKSTKRTKESEKDRG